MNIEVLRKLKIIESSHTLKILVINNDFNIPMDFLIQLKEIGSVVIAVPTQIMASQLIGKLSGLNYKIVVLNRIPIQNYDIIISISETEFVNKVATTLKVKYLYFLSNVTNINLSNYYKIEENCFKLTTNNEETIANMRLMSVNNETDQTQTGTTNSSINTNENSLSNYEIIVQDLAATTFKYDKYTINYLNPIVPGKISIIMIVSTINNNFAEVLRDIRSQNLPLIEYIIIDNAAGFRNNVKPNIRYGEQMPIDYCKYHAKELTTGEYIIQLDENSEKIDVMKEILKKNYETR